MAAVFKLQDRSAATTVDLLAGTLKLRARTWTSRTPGAAVAYSYRPFGAHATFGHYQPVVDSFDLIGADTGANLVAAIDALQDILARARRWHDNPLEDESIWLVANATAGESSRRSLIYHATLEILSASGLSPLMERAAVLIRVWLSRHPLWETPDYVSGGDSDGWTAWGGTIVPAADILGAEPGRLLALMLTLHTGAGPLTRAWVGIREPGQGTANFEPVWECEDGTNGTDAADAADATASDGNKVTVSFATTATLAKRMSITVAQVCAANGHADYDHQNGRYLVLCRCKVSAGTIRLQLRSGYSGNPTCTPNEDQYADNTSWLLIPLGEIQIPPLGRREPLENTGIGQASMLELWAERVSGASTLDLDAFCLIPSDHFAYADGANIAAALISRIEWYTYEDDQTDATQITSNTTPTINLDHTTRELYLPTGRPVIVAAVQRAASHVLTEDVSVQYAYFPRWLAVRGA